nr:hypothetical protein [uncultured Pseudomonas sp.]
MEPVKKAQGFFRAGYGWLNWPRFRDISVVLLMMVCSYRLAVSDLKIDLSGFSFTDLLSMVLAIFAIALSAAFYFKADESSKTFYDNSLKFTSHMSETLGRIEERFGESLKNIHEGYSGLSKKFDNFPHDLKEAREGKQRGEDAVLAREAEYKQALDDLMQRADLADGEKAALTAKLTAIAKELDNSKAEVASYKSTINSAGSLFDMSDDLFSWFRFIVRERFGRDWLSRPLGILSRRFNDFLNQGFMPEHLQDEATASGIIKNGRLSPEGAELFYNFISSEYG